MCLPSSHQRGLIIRRCRLHLQLQLPLPLPLLVSRPLVQNKPRRSPEPRHHQRHHRHLQSILNPRALVSRRRRQTQTLGPHLGLLPPGLLLLSLLLPRLPLAGLLHRKLRSHRRSLNVMRESQTRYGINYRQPYKRQRTRKCTKRKRCES